MSYSRTEIEHFKYSLSLDSEKIGITVAVLVIISVIGVLQWLVLHFMHLSLAMGLSAGIAFVFSWIYVGLKHASPNGGNYSINPLEYLIPSLLIFGVLILILIGVYLGETYLYTDTYNRGMIFLWIGICIGLPIMIYIGYLTYNYVCLILYYKHYAQCQISVQHYSMLPIEIHQLKFVNSKTGKTVHIHPRMSKTFLEPSSYQKKGVQQKHASWFHEIYKSELYQDIPRHTDKFYLSWFSPMEGKLYTEDYTFEYEPLKERIDHVFDPILLPLREWKTDSIRLLILKEGKIDLYIGGVLSFTYKQSQTETLSQTQILDRRIAFKSLFAKQLSNEKMIECMEIANSSSLVDKFLTLQKKTYHWKITLTGMEDLKHRVHIIDCAQNSYSRSIGFFGETRQYFVPRLIELYKESYLRLHLDCEALYDTLQELTATSEATPIDFQIHIEDQNRKNVQIRLQNSTQTIDFKEFETTT